jgi:hypothetical protein
VPLRQHAAGEAVAESSPPQRGGYSDREPEPIGSGP